MNRPPSSSSLIGLPAHSRAVAWERYQILRPHLEEAIALNRALENTNIPLRTAQRWVARYKKSGLIGLSRCSRGDRGKQKVLTPEIQTLIEGLALQKPVMSAAVIHRKIVDWCHRSGDTTPSYKTVYDLIRKLDPALTTLAHEGIKAYKQAFDLLHRSDAIQPNAVWQADHTLLDIWVKDEKGRPKRPWLTVIMDDYSRAISGYYLSFSSPSAIQTALALRQGIWRKHDPLWHICGIPEVLYTDHGSDFTSHHIEQVCLDLKIQLVFSTVGEPRGRGKIERFFRTINQRLLAHLSDAALSLHELDQALAQFFHQYHQEEHSQTKEAPQKRWSNQGFLPQLPESLEQLDLLLLMIKDTRFVQRDGIRFQGLRYTDSLLANYIGEEVILRYDPRDMTEVRIYHQNRFLCRAICPSLSTETVSLQEIKEARRLRRKQLKEQIDQRLSLVDVLMGRSPNNSTPVPDEELPSEKAVKPRTLKRYMNE